ncbi:MAG TPA: glycosyltransferase family 4 protein [Syntrophales bacterium]|nr:glycosyltransferase family 4 protein [Syntrophales bacterium]HOL60189.1 glycosyltransferase family 4 protein [Syntrophales bacterium]HPO36309.1 glycosyltransferase family 4 protein [Syntrophales bacterium]
MKILIVAYWHDPRFREKPGGLIRIFSLADNLLTLGYEVRLILPQIGFPRRQTRARVDEIPFLDFPFLRPLTFHLLCTFCVLFRCLTGAKQVYVRQMNSFLPLLMARLTGAFTFFEIPNDPFIAYQLDPPVKRVLIRLIDFISFRLAHRLVVLSNWTKKRLETLGHVAGRKIIVFPSGTDTELFRPIEKKAACARLALNPHHLYVGFIGSFLPYQGVETVIEAAPHIIAQEEKARFLLVGDGPMKIKWERKVQEKHLHDFFIFTGQVPYEEVPFYLGVMDVCVAPHRGETNQSSPVKIFDYMAAGKPIVASDIEAVREIVEESHAALLAQPEKAADWASKIIFLLKNEEKRQLMGHTARAYAFAHFDRKLLTRRLFAASESNPTSP